MRRFVVVLSFALGATIVPVASAPSTAQTNTWIEPLAPGIVRAPGAFSMVGVAWPHDAQPPASVRIRTSLDGTTWTPWTSLTIDDGEGPDDGGGSMRGTAPLWVGTARFATVELGGHRPGGAVVTFIDPGPDPARPWSVALASPAMPAVIGRAAWGADERMVRGAPRYASGVRVAFVHHTATGNGYGPADAARIVRGIQAYHVRTLGWNDIGYNALVDRYGRIFEGRRGGLDRAVIGAHARGFNTGTVGVSLIGSHSSVGPTTSARDALQRFLAWRLDVDHADPRATVAMRSGGSDRYPAGSVARLRTISGHRDIGHTDCPGGALHAALPSLRSGVHASGHPKIYDPVAMRPSLTPNGDGVRDDAVVTATASERVRWTILVVDGDGSVRRRLRATSTELNVRWDGTDDEGDPVPHGRYRLRLHASNRHGDARPAEVALWVYAWPDGTAFRFGEASYVLDAGRLRPATPVGYATRFGPHDAVRAPASVLDHYPIGDRLALREGTLIRVDGTTWLISASLRREVDTDAFAAHAFDRDAVVEGVARDLAAHRRGPPVEPDLTHPDGVALRGTALPTVWRLGGTAQRFVSASALASHGIRPEDVVRASDAEIALTPPGAPVGFRDGTLLRTPSSSKVWVVSNGTRRWISSSRAFHALGFQAAAIRDVSEAEAAFHAPGADL